MNNKYWKKSEIDQFKKRLILFRDKLSGNVNTLGSEAFANTRQGSSGNLSNVPIHLADVGTDNFERELSIELIENAEEELRNIDIALEKMDNKTYGRCEICDKMVTKTRLMAIPFVKHCITCQRDEEIEQPIDEKDE
ncbi:MAG: TraR/DksA family transcriptional regulator [Candidatus Anammoxibacter sp.]